MVTVLALGLAARHLRPEVGLWPQAAALAVPALTVGAASAGVWWAVRAARPPRRNRVAWAAAVVHLGLASVGLLREVGGRAPGADGPALTVLSLNVGQAPATAPGRLGEVLRDADPDVIGLQETQIRTVLVPEAPGGMVVATNPAVQPLLLYSEYETVLPPEPRRVILRGPTFARLPLIDRSEALLSDGDDAGLYSRTEVEWQGRRVAIYSVHLRSYSARPWSEPGFDVRAWVEAPGRFHEDMARRAHEAEQFRQVLDAETLPYLVLGDFNSTPHQWTYHHIAKGHVDALSAAGPLLARRTFPDGVPLVRIDGVLASPHWRVRSARVAPEGLSDHRGVIVDVVLDPSADGERP
ncbi:MAG: endonuclease/exonuclease/phosphatase family protein [Bacteroidota bacterium]